MKKIVIVLLVTLSLAGCVGSNPYPTLELPAAETSTLKVFPTLDPEYLSPVNSPIASNGEVESTPIPSLTRSPKITSSATSSPTMVPTPSCNYNDLISQAKVNLAGIEHVILINRTNQELNLYLWYVTSVETVEDLSEYRQSILLESTRNFNAINTINQDCLSSDFDNFSLIVVNGQYDIILSGKINPDFIPGRAITDNDDLSLITPYYELSFLVDEIPSDEETQLEGCSLLDIRINLQTSFGLEDSNQGIYYFLNPENVGSIIAQWQGMNTIDDISGKLVNVIFETACFEKPVDQIVINVVDENNTVTYIGAIASEDGAFMITDLQPIYIAP